MKSPLDDNTEGVRLADEPMINSSPRYPTSHWGIRVRDDNPFCFDSFEPQNYNHRSCGGFSKIAAPDSRQEEFFFHDLDMVAKEKKMSFSSHPHTHYIGNVLGYIPAKITAGKRWYVEWYSFNPETGKMHRKRLAVPHIKPMPARRKYANDMVLEINTRLANGWNPFLQLASSRDYVLLDTAIEQYCRHIHAMAQSGILRPKSYNGYMSYISTFRKWNAEQVRPIVYVYQLKKSVINQYLDYIWIDCQRAPRTRDNHLSWLKIFASWMMEKGLISDDPTAGLSPIVGKRYQKNRTVLPEKEMARLKEYLETNDRYFLLACKVLYYCFIRPKEMSYIRIQDISVARGTIKIAADVAKNGKDAVVTLPDCVIQLMIELHVLEKPNDWYLFSRDNMPGPEYRLPKYFCDRWTDVRKALKFPPEYKFYSLKDTGITDLIKDNTNLLAVRDQARHSSLQMTDLYTPLSTRDADETIRHRKATF